MYKHPHRIETAIYEINLDNSYSGAQRCNANKI